MADKPEFVDMISEATRQRWRRSAQRGGSNRKPRKARASVTGRRSRWVQWRMETLTPWKLKSWKFRNSDQDKAQPDRLNQKPFRLRRLRKICLATDKTGPLIAGL